jgi:YcxB-like protein
MTNIPETSESPVHVGFSLERGDLFKATLQMMKPRLLIGLCILVVAVAGFIYFFALIGELGLLLQLSPMFIGLPIMGIGGQLLRVHAACRKYFSNLSESQRQISYMFSSTTEGYDLHHGDSFSHIAWTDVSKVVEQSMFFLIYRSEYAVHLIPKRGFHQTSDISRFKSIVQGKLGNKATRFLKSSA